MLCVAQGAAVNDEKRMRFSNDEFYMKSEEEMRCLLYTSHRGAPRGS